MKSRTTIHDSRFTIHERRFLISAGPTREYIDPVRYISNDSSGQMGFALALAASKRKHKVTLISGPVNLATPPNVKRIDVVSAAEMKSQVLKHSPKADVIIMAAAVADWRPAEFERHKIKKIDLTTPRSHDPTISRPHDLTIKLKQNPDILKQLGKKKNKGQLLIGFALETENLKKNAREKLISKNCDWIIANDSSAIGKEKSRVLLISKHATIKLPYTNKTNLARRIINYILSTNE